MLPITKTKYPINRQQLLLEANQSRVNNKPFMIDVKGAQVEWVAGWNISRTSSDCIYALMESIGVEKIAKPRFYYMKPYVALPLHVDVNTQCSFNFVLSDNPAPIQIEGVDYFYAQALLNTRRQHRVINASEERVMLKLSILDHSYEKVLQMIPEEFKDEQNNN